MDNKILILVEGKADKKFLEDYITFHYPNISIKKENDNNESYDVNIISNGGKDFNKDNTNIIKIHIEDNDNITIIIIFDADKDFNKSKNNIKKRLKKFNINIKDENIFLFPNNRDAGCFETVLINIAVRKEIIECFDKYVKCISSLDNIKTPIDKSKIFAYLESIKKYKNYDEIKEENRNYIDKDTWDIENTYLNELKNFLNDFLIK